MWWIFDSFQIATTLMKLVPENSAGVLLFNYNLKSYCRLVLTISNEKNHNNLLIEGKMDNCSNCNQYDHVSSIHTSFQRDSILSSAVFKVRKCKKKKLIRNPFVIYNIKPWFKFVGPRIERELPSTSQAKQDLIKKKTEVEIKGLTNHIG